jgi:hypothetical protein
MKIDTGQTGAVVLTNTKLYPFNDSLTTVALTASQDGCGYAVLTEVTESAGEVGDIVVFGKAQNGFKLAFTGSASRAVVAYRIIGEDKP